MPEPLELAIASRPAAGDAPRGIAERRKEGESEDDQTKWGSHKTEAGPDHVEGGRESVA